MNPYQNMNLGELIGWRRSKELSPCPKTETADTRLLGRKGMQKDLFSTRTNPAQIGKAKEKRLVRPDNGKKKSPPDTALKRTNQKNRKKRKGLRGVSVVTEGNRELNQEASF